MQNNKSKNIKIDPKKNVKIRAYYFSLEIIKFTSSFPNQRLFWIIQDQLLRSAMSVGVNLIEAKASRMLGSSLLTLKNKRNY